MGLKPWRNVETEKTRERYTQGCLGESPGFESQVYISSSFSFEPLPRSVFLLSPSLSFCFSRILVPAVPGELPSRQIPDSTCAACDILPGAAMLIRLVLLVLSLVS